MEQKDTGDSRKGWFGQGKKPKQRDETTQDHVDKLANLRIGQEFPDAENKSSGFENWQPWNSARVIRISDSELRTFVDEIKLREESRAEKKLLKKLEELLGG